MAQENMEGLAKLAVYLRSVDPRKDPRGLNAEKVRRAAFDGLLEIGRRRADPRVARALLAMPRGYGKHALADLLGVIIRDHNGHALPENEIEAELRPFLIDDETIRQRIRDLARIRWMDNLSATLKAADTHEAEEYAEQLRARREIRGLIGALTSGNPELRAAAAGSLGRIGGPAASDSLRKAAATDTSPEVRQRAAMALAELGQVAEAADEAHARRSRATAHAIRKLIDDRVSRGWSQHDHDEGAARRQLTSIGADVVAPLLGLLQVAGGDAMRWEVLHALGELGDERAVDVVIANVRTSDRILQGQWHPATVDPYSDYYARESRRFGQASWALTQIGGPQATRVLDELRARSEGQERARRRRETRSSGLRPPITGNQVVEILGIRPGPIVGDALEYLTGAFPAEEDVQPEVVRARLVAWAEERGLRRGG